MSLQRELRLIRIYAAFSSIVLIAVIVLFTAGFAQRPQRSKFAEIDVERINVVEKDGTVRLVISNKDRAEIAGRIAGKPIKRMVGAKQAGLLFYNDEGDEVGGLTFGSRKHDGVIDAGTELLFDQYKQDQTIGFRYSYSGGQHWAGLNVWERSEIPLPELLEKIEAAEKLPEAEKAAVLKPLREQQRGPVRLFVGKTGDGIAGVLLADSKGKPRIMLKVEREGTASMEFLDEAGKVINRFPPKPNR